jgi:outer membrane protein assembly factor BamE (lipoprotein component of BamABCDE complex)
MTSHLIFRTPRLLLVAGLFVGVAAAQAASGYRVDKRQESQVTVGMNAAEVQQVLGRPESRISYHNEPGPTFTYRVLGDEQMLFDVDFDANGKVASTSERVSDVGGGDL